MAGLKGGGGYLSGKYWRERSDMMYYKYIDYIVRVAGSRAQSILDVGSGNSPYLEWFDWIQEKVSIDIRAPYSSPRVQAVTANILDHKFSKKFDICMCLQVLEHVEDPKPFARRLFELGDSVIISIPYEWPPGTPGHVNDPVDEAMLNAWTGRTPNAKVTVQEIFSPGRKSRRMICVYHSDPKRRWAKDRSDRKIRDIGAIVQV